MQSTATFSNLQVEATAAICPWVTIRQSKPITEGLGFEYHNSLYLIFICNFGVKVIKVTKVTKVTKV